MTPDLHPFECEVIETFTNEYRVRRRGGDQWLASSRIAKGSPAYYSRREGREVFREERGANPYLVYEQYYFDSQYNVETFKDVTSAIEMAKKAEAGLKAKHEARLQQEEYLRKQEAEQRARAAYVPKKVWR